MKFFLAAAFASLAITFTASADWVIEQSTEGSAMSGTVIMKIKGDKVRVDVSNGALGSMSTILDGKTGDMINLIHGQKMAMTISGDRFRKAVAATNPEAKGEAKSKAEDTGERETVRGLECEIWKYTHKDGFTKYWIVRQHPQEAALKEMKKVAKGFGKGLGNSGSGDDESSLPGQVVKTLREQGTFKMATEVLSIKEEPVDAAEFAAPADYQSIAAPPLPGEK